MKTTSFATKLAFLLMNMSPFNAFADATGVGNTQASGLFVQCTQQGRAIVGSLDFVADPITGKLELKAFTGATGSPDVTATVKMQPEQSPNKIRTKIIVTGSDKDLIVTGAADTAFPGESKGTQTVLLSLKKSDPSNPSFTLAKLLVNDEVILEESQVVPFLCSVKWN